MNKQLIALLAGVCMLLSAVAGGIDLCYAEEDKTEGALSLSVKAESRGEDGPSGDEGTAWGVYLSQSLCRITQGGSMALLLTAEASEGWRIRRVEAGEGAEGLTLTVGEIPCAEVSVLLDGRAVGVTEDGEDTPILRIFLEKDPENPAEQGGYMGVTAGKYGETALYVADEAGKVTVIPLIIEPYADETEEESRAEDEPADTRDTQGSQTEDLPSAEGRVEGEDSRPNGETEESGLPAEPDEPWALKNTFMGCRETSPRDGAFSVQFLFYGYGRDTPVVCAAGRGFLMVETAYGQTLRDLEGNAPPAEGEWGWSFCTFRGLSMEGEYTFWVFTEKGVVTVRYGKGKFCGYA